MTPDQIAKKLTAIRVSIARLQADRAGLVAAPDSRSDIADYWREAFAQAAADRARSLAHHLADRHTGFPLGLLPPGPGQHLDLLPMLAALFGADKLLEMLAPHLEALPVGLTHAERGQRLAELDAEIRAAEHFEMDLIEVHEGLGLPFSWRGDMSPAVILRTRPAP